MKILVIGGGGREHALVWKLRQSRGVDKLWCAPGNGGIAQDAECVPADTGNVTGLADLAERLDADLTVVGPEQPLVLGIADEFSRRRLPILAPSKAASRLEGSKIFSKGFLTRHSIPTAAVYGVFDSAEQARRGIASVQWPAVLKADGLCAGKGVLVAGSEAEANEFVERAMVRGEFGEGGGRLLVEEALAGQELSFIVLSDGQRFVPLAPARDHKRVFDNDAGPNTGGMGAYSTDDILGSELRHAIIEDVIRPTMEGLAADGCLYRGFLYFGLMLTADGPKVLEFNCRLGDPETQAVLPRVDSDLAELLQATVAGRLDRVQVKWKREVSLCVVMASGGYPGSFSVGKKIEGLHEASAMPDISIFHAGTKKDGGAIYTSGGRVLAVTALGANLEDAGLKAYEAVGKIHFDGAHFRRDIGRGDIGRRGMGGNSVPSAQNATRVAGG